MFECKVCHYQEKLPTPKQLGHATGNSNRYKDTTYDLCRCPKCRSISTQGEVDFADLYKDYVLSKRTLDFFAKLSYKNLLKRLSVAGINKKSKILDYGCGNGVFLDFLKETKYENIAGYDPYVEGFQSEKHKNDTHDFVIANDVMEHVNSPSEFLGQLIKSTKSGGYIYVGTSDADSVKDMQSLENDLMLLHLPYHRVLLTQEGLLKLGEKHSLELISSYKRSYMDTMIPFVNYRFLHELSISLDGNMDKMFDFNTALHFLKHPKLLFWGYFGYFFPIAYEPAVLWRKR